MSYYSYFSGVNGDYEKSKALAESVCMERISKDNPRYHLAVDLLTCFIVSETMNKNTTSLKKIHDCVLKQMTITACKTHVGLKDTDDDSISDYHSFFFLNKEMDALELLNETLSSLKSEADGE